MGNHAYVADSGALQLVDVSIPTSPRVVGCGPNYTNDLAVDENYAYVAGGPSFQILPAQCEGPLAIDSPDGQGSGERRLLPKAFSLAQNYPNPFNPSTTIAFDIPGRDISIRPVNLMIYDIRGRRVRTLIESELEPGSHKVHWDGRNDSGEKVSSGIYLYRLKAKDESFTRKMTIMK